MLVSLRAADGVAVIQICDAARRNALSGAMLAGLQDAFDGLTPDIRAVVLRAGPDDRVWCAGFDIAALTPGMDPLAPDGELSSLFARVHDCRAPVIAMLHGTAWGGGADLALRCDFAIGDPTCGFAFTPARLGLPYDFTGLRHMLSRGGPALAMEMFATAEPVMAERALQNGLLNHLVAEADLEAFTYAMAARIADHAPGSVASAKQHIRALTEAWTLPDAVMAQLEDGRRVALESADYAEGLAAFAERRPPRFTGR